MVTSKTPHRGGVRGSTVPGVILVILLLILPAAQLTSGSPASQPWEVFVFGVDLVAIALVGAIPWLRGRWARKLQRQLLEGSPSATVSIVTTWSGASLDPELGVLQVDPLGLTLHDSAQATTRVMWREIENIKVVQHGVLARESIHVITSSGMTVMRFIPMGKIGMLQLSSVRLRKYAKLISEHVSPKPSTRSS
jgi:hypothetical protein